MAPRRKSAVHLLLLSIVVLSLAEYLIATLAVQITEVPVRTDFASFYLAGKLTASHASPYDAQALAREGYSLGFRHDQYPFLYPPPFAVLMQPLSLLPYTTARAIWMLLSTICLAVALITTVRVVRDLERPKALQVPGLIWWLMVPFLVMTLNSTGVHNDLRHGSVGAMLYMAFILMLQAVLRGRAFAAGFWLAVAAVLKLVPLLLLPWLAWRAGRRAVAGTLITLVCGMIPALLEWGPSILEVYVQDALWPAAHLTTAWPHNVSMSALWMRLLAPLSASDASNAVLRPQEIANAVAILVELLLVGVTIATLWKTARTKASLALEFAALVLMLLLVMRITWVHTLTAMLFVYPVLMHWGASSAANGARRGFLGMTVTSLAFFLASAHLPVLWGERWLTWPWLLAPGLHTMGLLGLWGTCLWALRSSAQPPLIGPPGMTRPRVW